MNRELFGTDGVRGLAGEYPLNEEGARHIGAAVGRYFAGQGQSVIIGHDPRESSDDLVKALTEGLMAGGVQVVRVGIIPTPGLAYLTREHDQFKAGIMVTASHNGYEHNGIKVFGSKGDKLPDESEVILNKLIEDPIEEKVGGTVTDKPELIGEYEDFLVSSGHDLDLRGLNIATDTANGAASGLAQRVFERLGARVTPLFDHCDGKNINAHCGATDPRSLVDHVVRNKLALGIAVDGDADRLVMVDAKGQILDGDRLLYILAVSGHHKGVIGTIMSNGGLETALKHQHIVFKRTAVGDRYVLEELLRSGYTLGGEQSGHIIQSQLLETGDALLAAVTILAALRASGRSLHEWREDVQLISQATVNVPLQNKAALNSSAAQHYIDSQTKALGGQGRLLIRPSGTEPLLRVMVEADGAEKRAHDIADELSQLLSQYTAEKEVI